VNDPLFLTLDEVLQLHAESLQHFGGDDGIRDMGLIESAIAMPQQGFAGQYLHPDLAAMAAAYLFHLASNHGFVDGNKRVGARAAYVFLALNGCEVDFPLDQTEQLVLGVAKGEITKEQVTTFIRDLIGIP
jgi:death-on-curing protein